MKDIELYCGQCLDVLPTLPDSSLDCCVTSPPYWGLRDYDTEGQFGLEETPSQFVGNLVRTFDEVKRVLTPSGTLWLNLGDTYIGYHGNSRVKPGEASPSDMPGYRENMRRSTVGADGLKNKDLAGIPWRVAFALQDRGWYLRADIVWAKCNFRPEKVRDRPVRAHEYLFLFSKQPRYSCDLRLAHDYAATTVWELSTSKAAGHHASYPLGLAEPCILAGSTVGGRVLDPFCGTGTTGEAALRNDRSFIGIDINPEFVSQTRQRLSRFYGVFQDEIRVA